MTKATNKPGPARPGPGRPKGAPNKVTKALKDMILEALDQAGGVDYLVKQAEEQPALFLALIAKILPRTLCGDPDGSPIELKWQR